MLAFSPKFENNVIILIMKLISPESSLLFRIITGSIIVPYVLILIYALQQIVFNNAYSIVQKISWTVLILFLPFGGVIIYYSIKPTKP